MDLFNVYPKIPINLVKSYKSYVFDNRDNKYLDFYGGNAVISVGHNHPIYIDNMINTLKSISYYSNVIDIKQQEELAYKLEELSGCHDYNLFLVNSGAEANENALKLASFHNKRKKIISFYNAFHGRTLGALSVTDNDSIKPNFNNDIDVKFLPINDIEKLYKYANESISSIIIEGIQGMGGINTINTDFIYHIRKICDKYNIVMILDEIQSGYGRTGNFFAYQWHKIKPDIISIAKGMGNGFPVGAILIADFIKAKYGLLGTTFGGNYLACAASISVLDIIKKEKLINNVISISQYFNKKVKNIEGIKEIKGQGLMIGLSFQEYTSEIISKKLLSKYNIFTGLSSKKDILRVLPPLNISFSEIDYFLYALKEVLK